MPYVPVIPAASPQAQDLAQRLAQTVDQYRREHPELKDVDVARAFMIARMGSGGLDRRRRAGTIAALAGAFAAIAAMMSTTLARHAGTGTGSSVPWVVIILAVGVITLAIVAIVIAKANSSS